MFLQTKVTFIIEKDKFLAEKPKWPTVKVLNEIPGMIKATFSSNLCPTTTATATATATTTNNNNDQKDTL